MKKLSLLFLLAAAATVYSCKKEKDVQGTGGTVYLDIPANGNDFFGSQAIDANQKATLGRVLFYERNLSVNNAIACASCHKQELAFSDNVRFSRGFENRLTGRNSMPIQNLNSTFGNAFQIVPSTFIGTFFWDGRENNLANLIARPISNHVEMGITDLSSLPAKISSLPYYKDLFKKAYGSEEITVEKISDAMSMFLFAIRSTNTRFDHYQNGTGELTAMELEGQNLFNTKYACNNCHKIFVGGYTGFEFMNIGLDYPNVDVGAGAITKDPSWNGKFKIPNLRNVALTAPYMHDGRFAKLEDVLEHYSHGIQDDPNLDDRLKDKVTGEPMRMNISDNEKKAIVAFLNTLTDYSMITDDRYSSPFKVR